MSLLHKKVILVIGLLIIVACIHPAAGQVKSTGRLEQISRVTVNGLSATNTSIDVEDRVPPQCCPSGPCCHLTPLDKLAFGIEDLGIVVEPQSGSTIEYEEIGFEIYSSQTELLFQTSGKCKGCGKKSVFNSIFGSIFGANKSSPFHMFILDKNAITEAKKYFRGESKINVWAKYNGKIRKAYLVNAKELLKKP